MSTTGNAAGGKSALVNQVSKHLAWLITRPGLRQWRRFWRRTLRRISSKPVMVHYFHQADDPYSHLCAQTLTALGKAYAVEWVAHLVDEPADSAAPDRARLGLWSRRDSTLLAHERSLGAPDGFSRTLSAAERSAAEQELATALHAGRFAQEAGAIGTRLWEGRMLPLPGAQSGSASGMASEAEVLALKTTGNRLRQMLGHYLGATFYFDGEWYWGLDRLHYLEQRLHDEGFARLAGSPLLFPPESPSSAPPASAGSPARLHFFCSFRSPYTYLAVRRVMALAARHGAQLVLRPVLPMVMRGLPVPREKRFYIINDVAREAERLDLPYGYMIDPLGKPVERGYAVLALAMQQGRGIEFAESFLRGVWSEGVDAGTDAGLYHLAGRAGLTPQMVDQAMTDDAWRAPAEANRQELLSMGLWGVPSFRVNDRPGHWGQDRLDRIERDLMDAART